jgi:hypothetical protein
MQFLKDISTLKIKRFYYSILCGYISSPLSWKRNRFPDFKVRQPSENSFYLICNATKKRCLIWMLIKLSKFNSKSSFAIEIIEVFIPLDFVWGWKIAFHYKVRNKLNVVLGLTSCSRSGVGLFLLFYFALINSLKRDFASK